MMPGMKRDFKKELKNAFDVDHAEAMKSGNGLGSGKAADNHRRQVRTALTYRSQVEKHVHQMVEQEKSEELIHEYLLAARKMFRGFLGVK